MDRRKFLKLFGGGAAIASLGLLAGMLGCKKPPPEEPVGPDGTPGPPAGPEPGGPPPPPPPT